MTTERKHWRLPRLMITGLALLAGIACVLLFAWKPVTTSFAEGSKSAIGGAWLAGGIAAGVRGDRGGWRGRVDAGGGLVLARQHGAQHTPSDAA